MPGLVEAARLGTVSVVNGIGSGVLENPGLLPFLPRLCQLLLDEPLRLTSAPTWWCGDAGGALDVLAHLADAGLQADRPRHRAHPRLGWELSAGDRDELAARIEAEP